MAKIAPKLGAVVEPDDRRIHERPTSTGGGVAMLIGLLAALVVASRLPGFAQVFAGSSEALAVVVAATVMFGIGFLDDLRELSAPAKVAGQVLSASLLAVLGVTLFYFRVPFGQLVVLSADWATLITVLLVVVVANSVNLIDGLDGLAAGTIAIAAGAFYVYSGELQNAGVISEANLGPLLALVTLGICLGFLPHNFYPAKIFMGDGGALLLGLLMASATMTVGGRVVDQFSGQVYFFFAPIAIPFLILGVPLVDVALAIIRRAYRREGIATADKDHLHHRLLRMGHGHRRTVLLLWAWTALLSGVALVPTLTGSGDAVLPFALAGVSILLFFLLRPLSRVGQEKDAEIQSA
ncbi:MAG: undecaprenyl-phosphate alpha-N-acetylglucosaminyl 1-phosphate transferase [Acidimicrobiaceae bacterium]|nr:undecaprenyl-phosphate alpha-N-acetylglucosaminyl 1-phosphate transferase [Acidimicrobiaceae bacterium]HBV25815.1 undecaprenyl/decaprenyl-phosphate alpha-N-acetylglucosaminyl 1-phosphate transferase [Acidimicrobiaceae bacterium]HCK75017.1 undecaprenyl/decaprenyl-phosphate alpha-N-acetylglucosaminyl 1-phosphate transferase [Acidimicrobiaceae bacterium]|tara:strand:- start:517 stop:1572 length:1056 start_codon:yes stop_codon:yes gene_type:complete